MLSFQYFHANQNNFHFDLNTYHSLYTFGGGEHGQLGHNDRVNKVKPTFVEALDGIFVSQITCGWSHSVALTSKGRIFTWGNGDHGKASLNFHHRHKRNMRFLFLI